LKALEKQEAPQENLREANAELETTHHCEQHAEEAPQQRPQ